MGSGPGRPVKTHGPPHGSGGAAHIEPTSHGPRPGPDHQVSRGWAAARPGPSKVQRMGRGPTQPIHFSNFHGPARPGQSNFQKPRPGPARPRQTAHDKPWYFFPADVTNFTSTQLRCFVVSKTLFLARWFRGSVGFVASSSSALLAHKTKLRPSFIAPVYQHHHAYTSVQQACQVAATSTINFHETSDDFR